MLRTNYRCVQSPNISLDVAKWGQKFHKYTQYSHYLSVIKNDLSWLNNLFMVRFQLKRMPSYAKNKLLMCSVTLHHFRRRQMGEKFHKFTQYTHFLSVTKKDFSWVNNLFNIMFQDMRMSSYARKKQPMCSVTQHQYRRRQMWGNFHKFTKYTHFLSVIKKDLS